MFFPSLGQGRLLIDSACLFAVKVSIYQKVLILLARSRELARLSVPEGMEWMYCNESLPRIQKQIFVQLVISNMWFHYSCRRWERATCLRETRLPKHSPRKLNWGPLLLGVFKDSLQLGTSAIIRTATDTRCEELNLWIKEFIQMQEHLYNISVFVGDRKMDWNI